MLKKHFSGGLFAHSFWITKKLSAAIPNANTTSINSSNFSKNQTIKKGAINSLLNFYL
jgi:hypothetical protein